MNGRRALRLRGGLLSPKVAPDEDPQNWTFDGNMFCATPSLFHDHRVVRRAARNNKTHQRNRGEVFWWGRVLSKAADSQMRGFSYNLPQALTYEEFQVPMTYQRLSTLFDLPYTPHHIAHIFQNMLDILLVCARIGIVNGHLRPQNIWMDPHTFDLIFTDWGYTVEMENQQYPKFKALPDSQEDWYPRYFHLGRRATPAIDHYAAASILLGLAKRLWSEDDEPGEILPLDMHGVLDHCLSEEAGIAYGIDEYVARWRCPMIYYFHGKPKSLA